MHEITQSLPAVALTRPTLRAATIEWTIAAGLGLATLITRWPARTSVLAYWDSILYARALDTFTIVAHQPQPPGYFFYVMSGRLVRWLAGGNANDALVWVSLLAAGGGVTALYLLASQLYGRAAGLAAALFALTAVAPWSYSGVAYPYTVLALGSVVLSSLFWALRERRVAPWLAGLLFGLIGGFRQDLLLFLGPLLLVSLGWRPPRQYAGAGAGLLAGCLAWLVPSVMASGGPLPFIDALTGQAALVERDTSVVADGLAGLAWNLYHFRLFLFQQTLKWATIPLAIFALSLVGRGQGWRDRRAQHLLVWALPASLFYVLVHLGDVGYVFSVAPALFIAAGAGTVVASRWVAAVPLWRSWHVALPLGSALTPALVVWALLTGGPALYNDYLVFHTGRQHSLLWNHCRDEALAGSIARVRDHYQTDDTLLVAAGYFLHARHYLPDYQAWLSDPGNGPVFKRAVPPGVRHVVAFGPRMATRGQPNEERVVVGCDISLSIFHVQPGDTVFYQPDELWIG
jgi:hypothetical protein